MKRFSIALAALTLVLIGADIAQAHGAKAIVLSGRTVFAGSYGASYSTVGSYSSYVPPVVVSAPTYATYASPVAVAAPVYSAPVAAPVYAAPVVAAPVYSAPVVAAPVYAAPAYQAAAVFAAPIYQAPLVFSTPYLSTGYGCGVNAGFSVGSYGASFGSRFFGHR